MKLKVHKQKLLSYSIKLGQVQNDISQTEGNGYRVIAYGFGYWKDTYEAITPFAVLNFYKSIGNQFIHRIDGPVSIIIFNENESEIFIYTDPYRLFIFYLAYTPLCLLISDKVADLIMEIGSTINEKAYYELMLINCTIGSKTLYSNIDSLEDGNRYCIRNGEIFLEEKLRTFEKKSDNRISTVEFAEVFNLHVKRKLEQVQNTSLAITGGFDSRTILSACLFQKEKVFTYTHGFTESMDVQVAKQIAKKVQVPYAFYNLEESKDFIHNIPNYAEIVSSEYEGMLNSISHAHALISYENQKQKTAWFFLAFGGELCRLYYLPKNYLQIQSFDELADSIRKHSQILVDFSVFNKSKKEIIDILNQSIYMELKLANSNDYVFCAEFYYHRRNFNSVTTRFAGKYFNLFCPYFSQEIYELIPGISVQDKLEGEIQKQIIRSNSKTLSQILINQKYAIDQNIYLGLNKYFYKGVYYTKVLTNKFLNRWEYKMYFTDYDGWLKTYHKVFVLNTFHENSLSGSVLKQENLIQYLKNYLENDKSFTNYKFILNLLSTELFLNQMDNS